MIPLSYYQTDDTLAIAQDLLGKCLCTCIEGKKTSGLIIETEAYMAPEDKASHAYHGRRTARTEVMYAEGGVAYIYLCYGMHHLFNIVTHQKEVPHAILIRALIPEEGLEVMKKRQNKEFVDTTGPALLSKALGLTVHLNGKTLHGPEIWLEERPVQACEILATPRIGIDYAEEYIEKPWRFCLKKCME